MFFLLNWSNLRSVYVVIVYIVYISKRFDTIYILNIVFFIEGKTKKGLRF